jgi:hypothetical protein
MALLWVDGFEGYSQVDGQQIYQELGRRYSIGGVYIRAQNDGRFGGWSACVAYNNVTWFMTPSLTTDDTFIVCFAVKWLSSIGTDRFCEMWSDGTRGMGIRVLSTGEVDIYRGTTFIERSTLSPIKIGKWHWIEFKVVCDNSAGSYEVKVDGVTVLSASGVDTQQNLAYHDQVIFRGTGSNSSNTPRIDDLFIMDGTGGSYNDFIGQRRVLAITPNADTADVDWTVSGGSDHYALVDDLDPDDDTNYVEDSVTDEEDIWEYSDISAFDGSVDALSLITGVRITDASPYDLKTVVKSGGTKYDSSAETIGNSDYAMKDRLMVTDPDTGSAWTQNGINNVEMGVKVG